MQRGLIGRALLAELAQHATSSSQCQAPLRLATPSDGVATTAGGLSTTGSRSPRVATTVAARRTCARLVRLYACRATSYQRPQIERGHASLSRWPSYGRVGTIRALPRVVPKEPVSPRGPYAHRPDGAARRAAERSSRATTPRRTLWMAIARADGGDELAAWVVGGGGDGRLGCGVRGMRHSVGRSWPAPGEGAGSADGESPGGAGVGQAHLAVP